jgi:hypothetical protein
MLNMIRAEEGRHDAWKLRTQDPSVAPNERRINTTAEVL